MRKITAVLLIMLMLLCGCSKKSTAHSAEAPTLPQKPEITDNEYGSRSAENEDGFVESDGSFTMSSSTDKKADAAAETGQKPELRETQNIESKPSTPTPTPTPSPTPEPEFDIAYWVSYAKSYANSVELNLSSDAVDCWDNPITASSKCVCLERDIANRLERYAADEDISDVWIWSEALGNGAYNIYIGYA